MRTWELTHLSLSYANILEIDNLGGMTNLKELRLDNNIITRIQGLEDLVNLEWLDLSFNLIEKIEGLGTLTKLTDLSLYKNRIGVLQGLDNLHELEVLSIGCNKLQSLDDTVKYLKGLKNKLKVLRINDNLFEKTSDKKYPFYCISCLDELQYLDYKLIEKSERDAAREEHKDEIQEIDASAKEKGDGEMNQEERDIEEAGITCTVMLLDKVMKAGPYYSAVYELSGYQDLFNSADNNIEEKFSGYSQGMREQSKAKNNLITDCREKFRKAEIQAEKESIQAIDKYNSKWKHMQLKIEEKLSGPHKNDTEIHEDEDEIKDAIETLKCDLLDIELKMQDALKGAYTSFASQL